MLSGSNIGIDLMVFKIGYQGVGSADQAKQPMSRKGSPKVDQFVLAPTKVAFTVGTFGWFGCGGSPGAPPYDGRMDEPDGEITKNADLPPDGGAAGVVDQIIQGLCEAVVRCDSSLTLDECVAALEGEEGRQIWDEFGLEAFKNKLTSGEVRDGIENGIFVVNETNLETCLIELDQICEAGESPGLVGGDFANAENLIDDGSVCNGVLSAK